MITAAMTASQNQPLTIAAAYTGRGYTSGRNNNGAPPRVTVAAMAAGNQRTNRNNVGSSQRRRDAAYKAMMIPPTRKFIATKCNVSVSRCNVVTNQSGAERNS